ncbi:MAG: 2-phospho-L-lactate transferase [Actinomycetota bacterium]|nr:MAG: 2-phospho-L-lactate transferase [Actinomycetota bacterium]
MRITALAGGIGGARFLRGLLHHLRQVRPDGAGGTTDELTVIVNTGDDIRIHGLNVSPDLDSVMYTLGGGISEERGWGRDGETFTVKDELAAYGMEPTWFGLGDKDTATHLVRSQLLAAGYPLSAVTEALCVRWNPGARLLPMSDDRLETHVVVNDPDRRAIHFQEWWIRHRAQLPAEAFVLVGLDEAQPGPGVLEAITNADVVLLPPSNPVVSIGTILQVPRVRDALRATAAPVVGLSPIVGGAPVRGMADACLTAIGVPTTASAVARHYGPRRTRVPAGGDGGGLLDGWLVDELDADVVAEVEALGIRCVAVPLLMHDVPAAAAMAHAALDLAASVSGDTGGR